MVASRPLIPLAAAFVVLWSSGFVGAEMGTRLTGADTLLMWRFIAASALLVAFCALTGRRVTRAALRRHVPLGVVMQFVYLGGVFLGVQLGVSASTTALIAALQPLLVALAVARFGSHAAEPHRLSPMRLTGLALGFAGVVLVVGTGLASGAAPSWAYALPIVAMLGLGAGTFAAGRSADPVDVVTGMTIQMSTAAVGFGTWALLHGAAAPPLTWAFVGAEAWLVVLAGFGGYGTYLALIGRHGSSIASVLLYLTPPTTAVWTALMFGEPLSLLALVGMAVSALGVALFVRRGSPAGRDVTPGDGGSRAPAPPATTGRGAGSGQAAP
ncbi:DMT family transporter [Agilicoccus flavus]|uniref:DMT family transporter n=1 Tax=Agilicoccus flavus TaxID=2775968 RepID=UPI001CF6A49C|nr:DMT family transporter [Agilicoccus flavus]